MGNHGTLSAGLALCRPLSPLELFSPSSLPLGAPFPTVNGGREGWDHISNSSQPESVPILQTSKQRFWEEWGRLT